MSNSLIRLGLLCGLGLLYGGSAIAATDPGVKEIYAAAEAGHLGQAEQMIDQVLQDNPRSGKAHYVAAEIYARAGNIQRARSELGTAEQIDPGLPFANPASVGALQRQLSATSTSANASAPVYRTVERPQASLPWGTIIIVLLAIGLIWAFIRRRAASYPTYSGTVPPPVPGAPGYGAGPGPYPGGGYPGGGGSGLMGSLGTGLALGAGVAAGEELAHHLMDRDEPRGIIGNAEAGENAPPQNSNMGGNDFGVNDAGSWSDGGGDGGSFDSSVGGGDDWT